MLKKLENFFKGKRVLILGLGREGRSTLDILKNIVLTKDCYLVSACNPKRGFNKPLNNKKVFAIHAWVGKDIKPKLVIISVMPLNTKVNLVRAHTFFNPFLIVLQNKRQRLKAFIVIRCVFHFTPFMRIRCAKLYGVLYDIHSQIVNKLYKAYLGFSVKRQVAEFAVNVFYVAFSRYHCGVIRA